jgi:hypothetical protein
LRLWAKFKVVVVVVVVDLSENEKPWNDMSRIPSAFGDEVDNNDDRRHPYDESAYRQVDDSP